VVEVEEPPETLLAEHLTVVVHGAGAGVDERVVETLVVPLLVVVLEELAENAAEVGFAEGDDVVEALVADGAHEALGVGVEIGTAWRDADDAHALVGEQPTERGGVEWVAVGDQEALAGEEAIERVGEVATDLLHPGVGGPVDDAREMDPPGRELDDEEDVVADQAEEGEDLDGEEVRRGDGVPVAAQEGAPRDSPSSLRCGEDAIGGEDTFDGRAADRATEVREGADDAGVSPARVVPRDAQDQGADLPVDGRSAGSAPVAAVVLLGDQVPVPPQNRLRSDDRGQLPESLSAEALALLGEPPRLGVGEAQPPPAEVLSEHAILFEQVLDGIDLMSVHPACDGEEEEVERAGLHGRGLAWGHDGARLPPA